MFDIIGPDEDCTAGAAVFKGHDGDNDACKNKPLFRGKDEKVAHNPSFPEKMIFEGGGRKNCEYDRSEDDASGILVCDGVKAECTKLEPDPFKVDCSKEGSVPESWHKQIHCVFPVPSPPASTPPTPEFVVGYFDWCDEKSCGSEAAVFAPFGDDDFACAEKPIYRDAKPGPHDEPKLPEIVKWDGGGRKGCEFRMTSASDAGTMQCGTDKGKCVKNDEIIRDCADYDKKERWRAQATCTFDTFEGKPLMEPPAPPLTPPPPPAKTFAVGYFQKCTTGGTGTAVEKHCQSEAGIFVPPAEGEDKFFACIDKPLHRDSSFADKERPGFPQTISFEGGGRKSCEFKRTGDDDDGDMSCGKDRAIKCKKQKIEDHSCKDFGKDETWRTQLTCDFNSFDGKPMVKRGLEATSLSSLLPSSSFPILPMSSSMDEHHDLFPPALESALEPRAMQGRLYAIGFFQQCITTPSQGSVPAKFDCFAQSAIFVPGRFGDPFSACRDNPEYIGTSTTGSSNPADNPKMPQKVGFKDEWKRKCQYVREDRQSIGTLTCDGVASVTCKKEKNVPRDCAGKGVGKGAGMEHVIWRTEVTCYVKWV